MLELPKTRKLGEKILAPAQRFDALSQFLVDYFLPACAIFAMVSFPWLAWKMNGVFGQHLPAEARGTVRLMLGFIVFVGISTGAGFLFLRWRLRRRIYDRYIFTDDHVIRAHVGSTVIEAPWETVRIGKVVELGRVQTATLETPAGKIWFDATYVDANGPRPAPRRGWKGDYLLYPDTSRRPLLIRQNELFVMVKERVGE
ncbi:MAG: hypothetical protein GHCLOJNM_02140 [bacterium]|nr:hypothetical protein [bacterium]